MTAPFMPVECGNARVTDDDFVSLRQPRTDPAFRLLAEGFLQRGDEEIRKAIERATGLQLTNRRSEILATLRASGHQFGVRVSPDGTESFYVDEKLVLTFEPTALTTGADGLVTASRRVKHWGLG